MKHRKKLVFVVLIVLSILVVTACSGEDASGTPRKATDYPNRPITIIVPWGTGGGSDQMIRTWLEAIREVNPDVTFNVANMPGANGNIGLNHVMAQPADGYILYQVQPSNYSLDHFDGNHEFDLDDIMPIMGVDGAPDMFYLSGNDDRFDSWTDIAEYAKANPGKLKIGVAGLSGFTVASAGGLLNELDLNIELIPYGDPSERFAALMGGHVDLLFQRVADVPEFIESGEFVPVLTFANERMAEYPDVPTTVEMGAANSTLTITRGLAAPKGTPNEAVEFVTNLFDQAKDSQIMKDYLKSQMSDKIYIGDEFKVEFERQWKAFEASSK